MYRNLLTVSIVTLSLMTPLMGVASVEDDPTSLSYIAYLERYATVFPAGGEETLEAVINMPLVGGDRLDTAREARLEVILADGTMVWMDEYTTVSLDSVAFSRDTRGDRTVLFLADGAMMLELPATVEQLNPTRIDGASETVYLQGPGVFRVEVLRTGGLWVEVWEGLAEAVTPAGGVTLRATSATEVGGGRVSSVESRLTDRDDFARWVQARRGIGTGRSAEYVDPQYAREASQMDAYGTWVYLDSSASWAWQPTVDSDWRPYTAGRWYWTSVGWSWLAYEPWGWLPYHYGSWWNSPAHGWVWNYGRTWSPAWVHWSYGGGYVGWCPVGWYSSWWWGHGWGWGGHYPGHGGGYYPPHGGGSVGPPRGDVVPPGNGGGGSPAQPRTARAVGASDLVLDMEGRARRTSLDSRAWSVVSERDFASPRVGRIVRAGGDPLRTTADRDGMAVISSKPLVTASPRRATPATELARVFEGRGQAHSADLTRVVSRADSLSRTEALEAVTPRAAGAMTTERSSMRVTSPENQRTPAQVASTPRSGELSYDASVQGGARSSGSNLFRSNLYPGGAGVGSGSGRSSAGGSVAGPSGARSSPSTRAPSSSSGRSLAPSTGRAPVTPSARVPSSLSSRSLSGDGSRAPVSSSARSPVSGSQSAVGSRSSGTTGQSTEGQSRSAPFSRSPVVIPRTGSSSSSRSSRSPVVPRTSSGSRSAPSPRASTPSRSVGSSRSAPSRSSGSTRSVPRASSPSRSSSSSSRSAPRASSPSRSSGGSSSRSSGSSSSSGKSGSSSARRR